MFKLFKLVIVLMVVGGLAYVTFFVPLGEATLYQHLVGISRTDEARELGNAIEQKAEGVKEEVAAKVPELVRSSDTTTATPGADGRPLAEISGQDQRALDKLLAEKNK
jgi:hypothetical protein